MYKFYTSAFGLSVLRSVEGARKCDAHNSTSTLANVVALRGVSGVHGKTSSMGFTHQMHVVAPTSGGLWLWVERVEGHGVVMDIDELETGDLPAVCMDILGMHPWRNRGGIWLSTPRGRVKELPVPAVALTPEESVALMGQLCEYAHKNAIEETASKVGLIDGFAPELKFLMKLCAFVEEAVLAGRVMMRMERVDDQWFPRWTLSPAGDHMRVLQQFRERVPGVLTRNGGEDVVERLADEFAHWIAVAHLRREPMEFTSDFVRALATGTATRRGGASTVASLGQWRREAEAEAGQLLFLLSTPSEVEQTDEQKGEGEDDATIAPSWWLQIAHSMNGGPAEPINPATVGEELKVRIIRGLNRAGDVWPDFEPHLRSLLAWLNMGANPQGRRWWRPEELPSEQPTLGTSLEISELASFLEHGAAALRKAGFGVMIPRGWGKVRPRVKAKATPVGQGPGAGKLGMDQLMNFSWEVSLGNADGADGAGEGLDEATRRELLNAAEAIVRINGEYVFLDQESLLAARKWFAQVTKQQDKKEKTVGDVTVRVRDILEADLLSAAEIVDADHEFRVEADGWVARLLDGEAQLDPPEPVDVPAAVQTTLRDHQRRGLNWLAWMHRHRIGAILADDMGLGKTLQVLALLAWEREAGDCEGPTLVVAPTTVVEAWRAEAALHVPGLEVLVDHGSGLLDDKEFGDATIRGLEGGMKRPDLVVTTYGRVARNTARYQQVQWGRVVADEAQSIKNPATKQSRAVRSLPAATHIALTGTPVENRLSDLYAIMDFANPGIFGSAAAFQNRLAIPIERYGDDEAKRRLRGLVQPFILRRLKDDAAIGLDLPEKQDIVERVPLSREQAALYESFIKDMEMRLQLPGGKRRANILGALVKIKQICNHPAHYAGDGSGILAEGKHRSAKIERIFEITDNALEEGKKVLMFTQFPTFGKMLAPELEATFGVEVPVLHGGLSRAQRTRMVHDFQSADGPPIMILSVRAGGTGITLTEASVVIHIDRWWNPAVEDQATDRAYRIGQNKSVEVYKLVVQGTIDERIHDIIMSKRELAGDIVGAGEGWIANLDDAELSELLQLRESTQLEENDG